MDADPAELAGMLRRHESTGRALGERLFLERLSKQLARNLTPIPSKGGRPKKDRNQYQAPSDT